MKFTALHQLMTVKFQLKYVKPSRFLFRAFTNEASYSRYADYSVACLRNKAQIDKTHFRDFFSTMNAHTATMDVNSVPFCDQFDLDGIMVDEELSQRYQLFSVDDDQLLRVAVQISPLKEFRINNDVRELFVFRDGIVVFWNWTRPEQDQLMDFLKKYFIGDVIDSRTICEEEETMPFMMTYDNNPSRLHRDKIMLNMDIFSDKNEPEKTISPIYERFAFSHAMAASVKIGVWESRLEDMDGLIKECIKSLKRGKIVWSKKQALQKIGEFIDIRHSMQSTELLSEDFYWERHDLSRIYLQLCKNLCINHRQRVMNNKLDYCEEMSKTIHDTLHSRYSHHLEWLIIWLITVEVLIFIVPQSWIDWGTGRVT